MLTILRCTTCTTGHTAGIRIRNFERYGTEQYLGIGTMQGGSEENEPSITVAPHREEYVMRFYFNYSQTYVWFVTVRI